MKPHEETWSLRPTDPCVVLDSRGRAVGDFDNEENARLAHAAPDMARLLLDILNNYECGERVDAMYRAALAKTGVPLP